MRQYGEADICLAGNGEGAEKVGWADVEGCPRNSLCSRGSA